jgi:multicomponent Na+:H+ antiporter subunit D
MATLSNLALLAGRAGGAPYFRTVLALLGVLTALTAAVEGVLEPDLRRLADHAGRVAVGLVLVGMASMRPDGVAGAVLLGIDLLLGRALLVALAELTERRTGRAELEYLAEALPAQARVRGALLVGLAALSGAPPFVGFAARLLVYRAGFDTEWPIAVLAVAAGALWFYAMARVLVAASVLPPRTRAVRVSRSALVLAWLPAAAALVGGVQPGRLARWFAGLGG